ncbi:MAG: DUF6261 family protein [Tannerella sp.]|jgi:hypothetical protein|nr:DUF6261 family protein [Tannerella sp.]
MKRQIISVRFENLRNEAHVELNETVITTIDRYNPVQVGIEIMYAGYRQLVATEVSLLDMMRKNEYTLEIHAQDRVRDSIFRGLSDAVKSGLNHFDDGKCEAAGTLSAIFDHYANIDTRTFDEETAAMDDLLRELASDEASACVLTLAVKDWTEQLALENRKFKELMQARYGETAQRPLLRVHAVRADVDRTLHTILNYLDVVTTVHGPAVCELLVNELNTVFERYRHILTQQTGVRKKNHSHEALKREHEA